MKVYGIVETGISHSKDNVIGISLSREEAYKIATDMREMGKPIRIKVFDTDDLKQKSNRYSVFFGWDGRVMDVYPDNEYSEDNYECLDVCTVNAKNEEEAMERAIKLRQDKILENQWGDEE